MMSTLVSPWLAGILLGTLFKATALSAFALAALWLLRNASAARRHFVARTAVGGLLLIPLASIVLPDWSGPGLGEWYLTGITLPVGAEVAPPRLSVGEPSESWAFPTAVEYSPKRVGSGDYPTRPTIPSKSGSSWTLAEVLSFAGWIWLAGFLFCVARFAAGWFRVGRLVKAAAPVENPAAEDALRETSARLEVSVPALRHTSLIRIPMLWGLSDPVMLLPSAARDWTPVRMRLVFQHELAHLKRQDPFWLCVERIAQAIYWFHPFVWWIERKSRQDCEKACDDLVLNQGALASDYARQLLCIAHALNPQPLPRGVTLAMARTNHIEDRLVAILDPRLRRQAPSPLFARAVLLVAVLLILPISTLRVVARQASGASQARKSKVEAQYKEKTYSQKKEESARLETGEDWFGHAMRLHQNDRFEEAIEGFQNAVAKGYRNSTALYNIACGFSMLDNRDQAIHYLEMALDAGFDRYELLREDSDLDPLRADPRFAALLDRSVPAGAEEEPDRLNAALQEFQTLQAENSQDGSDWASVGVNLLRLRQFDPAIAALTNAVELLRDSSSTPLYNLACTYALRGDRARALDYLDQAVDNGFDRPGKLAFDPDLKAIRGEALFTQIQDKAYDLSLNRFRDEDGHHGKHGDESQDWGPAIKFFSAYVKSHPQSGRAWFNLGYAQHYSGLYPQAIDSFQQAVRWQYRPSVALYDTACAYARSNQTEKAFEYLARAEDAGFHISGYVGDDDLDSLHGDPRFEAYKRKAEEEHIARKLERKLQRKTREKN